MKAKLYISGLLAIFLFTSNLEAQIPTNGLIAYYLFNGNANDESGHGNTASSYLVSYTSDRCGVTSSACYFNGVDNRISLPPANFVGLNEYTYSLWLKVSSLPPSTIDGWIMLAVGSSTGSYQQIFALEPDGSLSGISSNTGNNPVITHTRTVPIQTDRWIHAVLTRDNTRLKIYVNSELAANVGSTDSLINNQPANYGSEPYLVTIGGRSNFGSYDFFVGTIDDVSIYNRALNDSEVLQLFDAKCSIGLIYGEKDVCQGEQQVPYSIQFFKEISNYSWSYSGTGAVINGEGANITVNFSDSATSGTLSVTITDDSMNEQSRSISVTVHPLPSAAGQIAGNNEVCAGQLGVSYTTSTIPEAEAYIWHYDGSGAIISGDLNNISIDFDENATSGTLTVAGQNQCGEGIKSQDFSIEVVTCGEVLSDPVIPNAFSPNGDGINDFLVIRDLPENTKLMIFNRSGKKLIEFSDYQNNWDGKDQEGRSLESGTYWYVISVPGIDKEFKGFVYMKK